MVGPAHGVEPRVEPTLRVPCTLRNPQEQEMAGPLPSTGPQQWYPVSACEVNVIRCLPVSLAYHPGSPAVGSPVRLLLAQFCASQGPSHGKEGKGSLMPEQVLAE